MPILNADAVLESEEWTKFLSRVNSGKDTKKNAFVILGGPGSGKSTIKKIVFEEQKKELGDINTYVNLDPDEILKTFFKNNNLLRSHVSTLFHEHFVNTMEGNFNLILDKIGDNPNFSKKYLIPLKQNGYTIHLCLILNKITSALDRVESRRKVTGRGVPRDYLINAYKRFGTKIFDYLNKQCNEIDYTYIYDNSGDIGQHVLLYTNQCPKEPEVPDGLKKSITSINSENLKVMSGGFKDFYEGNFVGSYPKYNGDYCLEFNKVNPVRDQEVLDNLKKYCNKYSLPRFVNNFFKGRPSQHRMGILVNPDAYKFIKLESFPDVCILCMPSPKYTDISKFLKKPGDCFSHLEDLGSQAYDDPKLIPSLEEQIDCFKKTSVKTPEELTYLKDSPEGLTLITWFINKELLENLKSGREDKTAAVAEDALKKDLTNAFFKGETGKTEFRRLLLDYITDQNPDAQDDVASLSRLLKDSPPRTDVFRYASDAAGLPAVAAAGVKSKIYSSVLDLDEKDIPLLKEANTIINEHLSDYYGVVETDSVKKYFHFPYGQDTITLHLHVRINQAYHPGEFFRSFQLEEDLISRLPSTNMFEIVKNELPFNIGAGLPGGLLDVKDFVTCFKPAEGDTELIRSLRLIPNPYIIGCDDRDGTGDKVTSGKWIQNAVSVNLADYTKKYSPPPPESLIELNDPFNKQVLKGIIEDATVDHIDLCASIISVHNANEKFESLLTNGCKPTYLRGKTDGGTVGGGNRKKTYKKHKRNKSKLLKSKRKRFNNKTKKNKNKNKRRLSKKMF